MNKLKIVVFIILIYLFFKYCFVFLSPFICGYLIAKIIVLVKPKNKLTSLFLYGFIIVFLLCFIILLLYSLYSFLKFIYLQYPQIYLQLSNFQLNSPFLNEVITYLLSISHNLVPYLSKLIILLPKSLSFIFFTSFLTCIYLFDIHAIGRIINHLFPSYYPKLKDFQNTLFHTLYSMIISSLKLSLLSFVECLILFLFLQVEHPIFYAFLIALFDAMPLLGTGTILVPLSIYLFIVANPHATYYFIGYLIMSGLRFIIEPKILSKQLNIPLLLHLFMTFLCGKLFGWLGFFYSPIFCVLLLLWYKEKQTK